MHHLGHLSKASQADLNGDQFKEQYSVILESIWSEKFILVGSKKYYNKNIKGDHSYKQIIECNFLSYVNHAPVLKMWFKHHFKKSPTQFKIGIVVENVHGIINGIQADIGLGVVPDYLVEPRIKEGSFIKISIKDKEFKKPIIFSPITKQKTHFNRENIPFNYSIFFKKFIIKNSDYSIFQNFNFLSEF